MINHLYLQTSVSCVIKNCIPLSLHAVAAAAAAAVVVVVVGA